MIFDRYYQWAAMLFVFLVYREHAIFAVLLVIAPIVVLLLPVFVGLLIWQELSQRIGSKRRRNLLRLRWELSRKSGAISESRRAKAAKALIEAYDLSPGVGLPEQAERLAELMNDAYAIDRSVPRILQRPLTAAKLGAALAEAAGLSGVRRTELINALYRSAPRTRPSGPLRPVVMGLRRLLAPFAGSKLQRQRIGWVFSQVIFGGAGRDNARLAALFDLIRDRRESIGLDQVLSKPTDPIVDLPLSMQREIVLFSELAFGIADMTRLSLTDPSRINWMRALRDRMDSVAAPDRRLWDVAAETPPSAPAGPSVEAPEPTEADLRDKVERDAKPALYLKRAWPIGGDSLCRSWLGGRPMLPESMSWPKLPRTGHHLHFLAQIDCAELPKVAEGEALPEDGLMLFFADISEEMPWHEEQGSVQVLYVPAQIVPDRISALPGNLPEIGHVVGQMSEGHAKPGIRSYPCWPVTVHRTKTYSWNEGDPWAARGLAREAQASALQKHLPKPSETFGSTTVMLPVPLLDPETNQHLRDEDGQKLYRYSVAPELINAGFPFCSGVMSRFFERLEGALLQEIDKARRSKLFWKQQLVGKTPEEAKSARAQISQKTNQIAGLSSSLMQVETAADRLIAGSEYELPSEQEAHSFVEWLGKMHVDWVIGLEAALQETLLYAVQQAVTDAQLRAMLPQELFDSFDRKLRPSTDQSQHMMLGYTQLQTNSTSGPGLRLLSLDSDYGLNFMFCDVGMAEFWIEPEALAQRDFSKVVGITTGG